MSIAMRPKRVSAFREFLHSRACAAYNKDMSTRRKPRVFDNHVAIYLAVAGLALSISSVIVSARVDDLVTMGVSFLLAASLWVCKYLLVSPSFYQYFSNSTIACLTLIGYWMLGSVPCSNLTGRAAWAGVTSLGSAALLQFVLKAQVTFLVAIGGFIAFQIVGLLVGIMTLNSCSSMSALPTLALAVSVLGLSLSACSFQQLQDAPNAAQALDPSPTYKGDTISLLNDAAGLISKSLLAVPAQAAASLQQVKQLLNDAKISAKADIVLLSSLSTSSRPTDTTASVTTAVHSNRNLLDKETTRWLTSELQAASTRSFVRMGTKLRDGIKASHAHRTELLRTNSDQSKSATQLSSMDGSGLLQPLHSARSPPSGRALTNSQIRQTLSRASFHHTASVVSVLQQSATDLLLLGRERSSGSTNRSAPLPLLPGKTLELDEMAEMVSDRGIDTSDDGSEADSRHTLGSSAHKAQAEQRLLAARSFHFASTARQQPSLLRTYSQPDSMRKLLSDKSSASRSRSSSLLDFLPVSDEVDDEYLRTRTLLHRKRSAFAGLPIPSNLQFVIAFSGMNTWKFNVFRAGAQCGARPLACVASVALEGMGLLKVLNVKRKVFSAFIMHLERTYSHDVTLPNPYHNSFHAADVVQATQQFLLNPRVNGVLTDFNATACLVAAAAHDYRHPGVNNTFLVNTSNVLAIRYNDMAVLEHFHAAETFQVFDDPSMNILGGLDEQARRSMRTSIIQCILATDLADGRKYTQQFADRADHIEADQLPADHVTLMQMCLKCADVCHAARPLAVHEKWSLLVTLEFHQQGDLERSLGLAISPLCDKHSFNMARSQLGFVEFVVRPCLAPFADWCGNSEWTACLSANEQHWLNMRALEDVAASESKRSSQDAPAAAAGTGADAAASSTADSAAAAPMQTEEGAVLIQVEPAHGTTP